MKYIILILLLTSCSKVRYCPTYKTNYHTKQYNKATTKCPTYGND